jgi:protein phosphatase
LTPEQAEHHPNRNLLMRALGRHPSVEVELGRQQLQAGDVLIMCSDGLTGVVRDEEIARYAGRYAPTALAEELVRLANQRGAPDNVTVVAAAIAAVPATGDSVDGAATTTVLPQVGAPTPGLVTPLEDATTERLGDVPTDRRLPRPGAAAAAPRGDAAATASHNAPGPAGTPIVVSRSSAPAPTARIGAARPGRGRWLAGALAAFGLAAALVLLTLLRSNGIADNDPPRLTEAPPPAATPTTRTVAAAPVAATVALIPTGIPGLTAPGSAPAAPATAPTAASAGQPAAVATPAGPAGGIGSAIAGIPATATQLPTLAASPPALVVPTATPTPAQRSADEPTAPIDAGSADAPAAPADAAPDAAPEAAAPADVPPDAAAPEATAPDSGAPEAAAPDDGAMDADPAGQEPATDPAAQEPAAEDPPPPPPPPHAGPPGSGPRLGEPSGFSVPPIPPGFRSGPTRKRGN